MRADEKILDVKPSTTFEVKPHDTSFGVFESFLFALIFSCPNVIYFIQPIKSIFWVIIVWNFFIVWMMSYRLWESKR